MFHCGTATQTMPFIKLETISQKELFEVFANQLIRSGSCSDFATLIEIGMYSIRQLRPFHINCLMRLSSVLSLFLFWLSTSCFVCAMPEIIVN